jgi:hypothetical protein
VGLWFETVTDLTAGAEALCERRYGMIEAASGRLTRVRLRPWPRQASWLEVWWAQYRHHRQTGDTCRLHYAQPLGHDAFLTIKYVEAPFGTSVATHRAALAALEHIARLKGCHALLCQAKNPRLTDRLLARAGWQRHAFSLPGRNFIRRLVCDESTIGDWSIASATHPSTHEELLLTSSSGER